MIFNIVLILFGAALTIWAVAGAMRPDRELSGLKETLEALVDVLEDGAYTPEVEAGAEPDASGFEAPVFPGEIRQSPKVEPGPDRREAAEGAREEVAEGEASEEGSPRPEAGASPLHGRIVALSKQGLSVLEIARAVGMPVGEVDVVLSLNRAYLHPSDPQRGGRGR